MQQIAKYTFQLLAPLCSLMIFGCGGEGILGEKTMEISELGVSMPIPAGWRLDNPQMCHKGDNTGLIMEEGLEGQTFEKCAAQMSKEFGSTVISESTLAISGHKAIKAVIKTPSEDVLVRVYIQKGEKMIWISFVILKDEYPDNESALQQSIQSITIKS